MPAPDVHIVVPQTSRNENRPGPQPMHSQSFATPSRVADVDSILTGAGKDSIGPYRETWSAQVNL